MSCHILSDDQFAALAWSYGLTKSSFYQNPHLQTVLNELVAENYRSVNARYNENTSPHEVDIGFFLQGQISDPVEILALCNLYEYQSGATADYRDSLAAKWVNQIRSTVIKSLPGYEEAYQKVNLLQSGNTTNKPINKPEKSEETLTFETTFAKDKEKIDNLFIAYHQEQDPERKEELRCQYNDEIWSYNAGLIELNGQYDYEYKLIYKS